MYVYLTTNWLYDINVEYRTALCAPFWWQSEAVPIKHSSPVCIQTPGVHAILLSMKLCSLHGMCIGSPHHVV